MAFSETADGRIAGHLSNGIEIHGKRASGQAHPGGCQRSLAPRVARPYDNYLILRIRDHRSS
jgi:hypothetical protein